MNQVKDGTYIAESDGGMVKVKVEVTVIDHQIQDIKLIEHRNGKGKPAEAMLEVMIHMMWIVYQEQQLLVKQFVTLSTRHYSKVWNEER